MQAEPTFMGVEDTASFLPEHSHLVPEGLELLWRGVDHLQDLHRNVSCSEPAAPLDLIDLDTAC